MSRDQESNHSSSQPSPTSHHLHLHSANVRKVSIIDNTFHDQGHVFESGSNKTRKISTQTDHAVIGPVRKKSILHNHVNNAFEKDSLRPDSTIRLADVGSNNHEKKKSTTESVHSKLSAYSKSSAYSRNLRPSTDDAIVERSWWYAFCIKCRSEETRPSWQPSIWHKLCPYPFCPTYRQFSRIVALVLIGLLTWGILYAIVGDSAAPPDGILYQLIILSIGAYLGGWLMSLTTLPALIGMVITGILFQNVGVVDINSSFTEINSELRHLALVILLIRAGLDLDPHALKRLKFHVIKLGFVPWMVEAAATAVLSKYLLSLPWDYALLLGSIVAAVAPAVVVSALFRLRQKGYGVAKGIPTLIIAIASVDDAFSVAIFGIVKSIMFSDSSIVSLILQGPASILGGIAFGVLWGVMCSFVPEKHDPFMVPLRILLLLVGGTISVFGSELIGYGGAGPLACLTAAFTCLVVWSRQGWEIEDNPAATAFQIFWMIFEPILFGITGAQVKFNELDPPMVLIGVGILVAVIVLRMVVTVVVAMGCNYNMKEKVFVAFALMAKATVQAALGPSVLSIIDDTASEEYQYATNISMVCVLSIVITAPTSAILIALSGPWLLTKGKLAPVAEGRRISHRPSIRDISLLEEDMEGVEQREAATANNTVSEAGDPKITS